MENALKYRISMSAANPTNRVHFVNHEWFSLVDEFGACVAEKIIVDILVQSNEGRNKNKHPNQTYIGFLEGFHRAT